MSQFETIPLSESPFQEIVNSIQWQSEWEPKQLEYAAQIGCLIARNEMGHDRLVMFSDFEADQPLVSVPRDVQEARARWGRPTLSMINTDLTAKGLGFAGANSPLAVHHPDKAGEMAVRYVPLRPETSVMIDEESNTKLALNLQWLRHAALMGWSMAGDALPGSQMKGTRSAMRYMQRNYGDADIVVRNAPPSWQRVHTRLGIDSPIPPKKILVPGQEYKLTYLRKVGSIHPGDLLR